MLGAVASQNSEINNIERQISARIAQLEATTAGVSAADASQIQNIAQALARISTLEMNTMGITSSDAASINSICTAVSSSYLTETNTHAIRYL